jgi:hypothetical protein
VLVELVLPFVDASAADLTLTLDAPPQAGLGVLKLGDSRYEAELRLLGSSHQALVRGAGVELSELVACRPGETGALPERAVQRGDRHDYEFRAEVRRFEAPTYARVSAAVVSEVAAADDGLVGIFPGLDGAFTALRFATGTGGELRWRTWHGYPQTREVVVTTSRVAP